MIQRYVTLTAVEGYLQHRTCPSTAFRVTFVFYNGHAFLIKKSPTEPTNLALCYKSYGALHLGMIN